MNSLLLRKGLKRMSYFLILCFVGPFVVHQAFQNKTHPLYLPVLLVGIVLLALAFYYGFTGIRTLIDALLGKKKKDSSS
ncbi:DUF6095 family protein [Flavobacteriaceae bacterium]|nr:hypothetical protein [Flavobacteriaceae bacterium]MDA7711805.1 DUF6095 family protein [Flavobacteriaceae bacterium]MDA8900274.1 DUF6095 family protein [Flavobacteriaceae bacterium]